MKIGRMKAAQWEQQLRRTIADTQRGQNLVQVVEVVRQQLPRRPQVSYLHTILRLATSYMWMFDWKFDACVEVHCREC